MKEILKIPIKANLYQHQQNACRFACERFGILSSEVHSNGVALLMEMGCREQFLTAMEPPFLWLKPCRTISAVSLQF